METAITVHNVFNVGAPETAGTQLLTVVNVIARITAMVIAQIAHTFTVFPIA